MSRVKVRQNPLSKIESWLERGVNGLFSFIPSRLQPTEVARKLERAMEDNTLLQSEGRRLAPNVYDIYISIKDHQLLSPSEAILKKDWQDHLINVARHRHYTLRSVPVLRLHASSELRSGAVRIEAELLDQQHMGGEGGLMATQALSAEQLAQLRAQLPQGQPLPGIPHQGSPAANPPVSAPLANLPNFPQSGVSQPLSAPLVMPQAWLTIRSSQGAQQVYRIEKPVVNIGRQLTNDIIVEDKRVSRYHAQIKYQANGEFSIFDLGSTNGITVNGIPHLRQHTFRNGDRFTIGSYDFYFERR